MRKENLLLAVETEDKHVKVKFVPNQTTAEQLDPRALEELISPQEAGEAPKEIPTVEMMRSMMGWPPAKDISQNKLTIENCSFAGITVRSYVKTEKATENLPAIVFYHGGGFFGGSLDNVELPCRRLADLADIRVFSVDYGLAPEFPYPKAALDAYQALVYIHHHHEELLVLPEQITVMGDSAGGNLTYVISFLDRLFGTNYVKTAVSLYPVVYQGKNEQLLQEFYDVENIQAGVHTELIQGYIIGFMQSFNAIDTWYIRDANPESFLISPYNATEKMLKTMPRTLFIVGEFDALRVQGEAFYQKAKAAGADIYELRYEGMVHAFMDKVGDFVQADDCLKESVNFILNDY